MHEDKFYLDTAAWPGLAIFLAHSECVGVLTPEECLQVAADLEKILPNISDKYSTGHLSRGAAAAAERFMTGCRAAAEAGENLEFK